MPATTPHIQEILKNLPTRPGVYLMKNAVGEVIYVGKAVNLRNRVRTYFHSAVTNGPQYDKTTRLVQSIAYIEFIVVDSEIEAL